jgi:hypothetical protein
VVAYSASHLSTFVDDPAAAHGDQSSGARPGAYTQPMDVAVGPTLALYIGIVVVIIAVVWLVRRRR